MTLFLSLRSQNVGGAVIDPMALRGDGTASPLALQPVGRAELAALVAGKNLLLAVHGFNVSMEAGACSLGQLEPQLDLASTDVFFAVLWPGDFWIPAVNYPFEGDVALDCGRRLARFCASSLAGCQSLSFVSHSLGARVVLEAVKNLGRTARVVSLTAAAINRDCLDTQYAPAAANSSAISILASHGDYVLKYAYRIGDPISNLLHDDHQFFEAALGYAGPPVPARPPISAPWQISDQDDYGHGDYLPPGDAVQSSQALQHAKWLRVAQFMSRAFQGQRQTWPS
jgi:Alpha/beta hydrolase of unknown function (DUF900)